LWSAAYTVGVVEAGPDQPHVWRLRARLYLLADCRATGPGPKQRAVTLERLSAMAWSRAARVYQCGLLAAVCV